MSIRPFPSTVHAAQLNANLLKKNRNKRLGKTEEEIQQVEKEKETAKQEKELAKQQKAIDASFAKAHKQLVQKNTTKSVTTDNDREYEILVTKLEYYKKKLPIKLQGLKLKDKYTNVGQARADYALIRKTLDNVDPQPAIETIYSKGADFVSAIGPSWGLHCEQYGALVNQQLKTENSALNLLVKELACELAPKAQMGLVGRFLSANLQLLVMMHSTNSLAQKKVPLEVAEDILHH